MTASYILTVSCPDRVGIVAAVAGVLADSGLFITDSHHFGDPDTKNFFMRTAFEAGNPEFNQTAFTKIFEPVAARFGMRWALKDCALRPSALILVSKSDHCLNDLLYRHRTGALPVHIPAIVSNHMNLAPLAEWHRIPFLHVPVSEAGKPEAEARLRDIIAQTKADFIVLARYMQIFSPELCAELEGRAINIHHSFLPSFKGAQPYRQAHKRGVKLIGATAHFVFDRYTTAATKVESVTQASFVFVWYVAGLLLIAIDLRRPSEPGHSKIAGWIVWMIAALAGCCSVGWFMPS